MGVRVVTVMTSPVGRRHTSRNYNDMTDDNDDDQWCTHHTLRF